MHGIEGCGADHEGCAQDHEGRTKSAKAAPAKGRAPRRRSTAKADGDAIEELSRHAAIEELVFYPAVRAEVDDAKADVLEALEEHHVVKWLLHELLPEVRAQIGRKRLLELGAELRDATSRVPTRPHPAAPDKPPGNVLVGGRAVAAFSRARTVGKRAVERVRNDVPAR